MMSVPLVDLQVNFRSLETEVRAAIDRVLSSGGFVGGPEVEAFEAAYAACVGVRHCVGVGNGTDAIELMLRAGGVKQGAGVLVPANTFVASALGVQRAGARVQFVDCTEDGLIDVGSCEQRADGQTEAMLPVHLYGQCADLVAVERLAAARRWLVFEDSAQAHGARQGGRNAGAVGLASATSFYPGKNLGAYGDAGAVTTNDEGLARRVRVLRNYGAETKYVHSEVGSNSRLDALQAAVLGVKLRRLEAWNAARNTLALRYASLLANLRQVTLPRVVPGNQHVWHLYVVRVPAAARDHVVEAMRTAGVGVGVHYPRPLHLQKAFEPLGYRRGDFPRAERLAAEQVSLPMFPELTEAQQTHVVNVLARSLESA